VEGRTLEALFAGRPVNISEMLDNMRRVARAEGLAFGDRRMTYNSRLAQELGKWAESRKRGEAFNRAAFAAYFAEGKNIALPEVLADMAAAAGLSPLEARQVIDERRFRDQVDKDWERSRRLGVGAVPTFMIGDERLVGAQPYEALAQIASAAGAPKKEPQ
jgi:predicted DsbA family dithiol-disulfide isomerase